jgi:agmatine deiminase
MKRLCGLVLVSGCVITKPGENGYQDYVLIGTPVYENVVGRPTEPLTISMIAAMLPSVKVGLVTQDEEEGDLWRDLVDDEVSHSDLDNLEIFPAEHTDIWFRDMGGIFVTLDVAGYETLAVVDPEFDGWGYGPVQDDFARDNYAIDDEVAGKLGDLMGIPVIYSPLIFEGGAITSNGAGTLLYSLPALTQRNPSWSQTLMELELKRVLGPSKVIAVPVFHPLDGHAVVDGPLELDGRFLHHPFTVRHVDEIIAFVDEDTLLVSQFPQEAVTNAIEQEVHDRLVELWDFLEAQTDQDGQPFELVAFPDPGLLTETMTGDDAVWLGLGTMQGLQNFDPDGGEVALAASYMNFVITNGVVLVPSFYQEGRPERLIDTDAEAVAILQEVYPDREVISMDVSNIVNSGGGMHCITQEVRSLSDGPDDHCDDHGNGHGNGNTSDWWD